ncbi:uncharacterized protein prr14 isoform X2 [Denticeps clupeoides]|nr:uncharacterized protein LOC114794699 isoform X2 [Denticeps clupeoides]
MTVSRSCDKTTLSRHKDLQIQKRKKAKATTMRRMDETTTGKQSEMENCPESPPPVKRWVIGPLLHSFKSKMASFTEIVMSPVRLFKPSDTPAIAVGLTDREAEGQVDVVSGFPKEEGHCIVDKRSHITKMLEFDYRANDLRTKQNPNDILPLKAASSPKKKDVCEVAKSSSVRDHALPSVFEHEGVNCMSHGYKRDGGHTISSSPSSSVFYTPPDSFSLTEGALEQPKDHEGRKQLDNQGLSVFPEFCLQKPPGDVEMCDGELNNKSQRSLSSSVDEEMLDCASAGLFNLVDGSPTEKRQLETRKRQRTRAQTEKESNGKAKRTKPVALQRTNGGKIQANNHKCGRVDKLVEQLEMLEKSSSQPTATQQAVELMERPDRERHQKPEAMETVRLSDQSENLSTSEIGLKDQGMEGMCPVVKEKYSGSSDFSTLPEYRVDSSSSSVRSICNAGRDKRTTRSRKLKSANSNMFVGSSPASECCATGKRLLIKLTSEGRKRKNNPYSTKGPSQNGTFSNAVGHLSECSQSDAACRPGWKAKRSVDVGRTCVADAVLDAEVRVGKIGTVGERTLDKECAEFNHTTPIRREFGHSSQSKEPGLLQEPEGETCTQLPSEMGLKRVRATSGKVDDSGDGHNEARRFPRKDKRTRKAYSAKVRGPKEDKELLDQTEGTSSAMLSGSSSNRLLRSFSCPEIPSLHHPERPWSCPTFRPHYKTPPVPQQHPHSPPHPPRSQKRVRRHTVCSMEIEREIAPLCLRKEVYPTGSAGIYGSPSPRVCSSSSSSPGSFTALVSCFLSSPLAFLSRKLDQDRSGESSSPPPIPGFPLSSSTPPSPFLSHFSAQHLPTGFTSAAPPRPEQSSATLSSLGSDHAQILSEGEDKQKSSEDEVVDEGGRSEFSLQSTEMPEEKAHSDSEAKSYNTRQGQRGKVSAIRIRKALPRPLNNLTPMGLPKAVRVKKKVFSVEEIYTNKNFSKPPESRLQTIFEDPVSRRDGSMSLTGLKRMKRFVEFPEVGVARKPRKPLAGTSGGIQKKTGGGAAVGRPRRGTWCPSKDDPTLQDLDSLLCAKLSLLDSWLAADQAVS